MSWLTECLMMVFRIWIESSFKQEWGVSITTVTYIEDITVFKFLSPFFPYVFDFYSSASLLHLCLLLQPLPLYPFHSHFLFFATLFYELSLNDERKISPTQEHFSGSEVQELLKMFEEWKGKKRGGERGGRKIRKPTFIFWARCCFKIIVLKRK